MTLVTSCLMMDPERRPTVAYRLLFGSLIPVCLKDEPLHVTGDELSNDGPRETPLSSADLLVVSLIHHCL
jgi:hypothetical protein